MTRIRLSWLTPLLLGGCLILTESEWRGEPNASGSATSFDTDWEADLNQDAELTTGECRDLDACCQVMSAQSLQPTCLEQAQIYDAADSNICTSLLCGYAEYNPNCMSLACASGCSLHECN